MGESQQDWVEAELNNKKETIAELRDKIEKEREINQQLMENV